MISICTADQHARHSIKNPASEISLSPALTWGTVIDRSINHGPSLHVLTRAISFAKSMYATGFMNKSPTDLCSSVERDRLTLVIYHTNGFIYDLLLKVTLCQSLLHYN